MIAPDMGDARFRTRISTWNLPSDGKPAGGDWCRTVHLTDDVVALTIGDVSGHDAAAAEAMATICGALVAAMDRTRDPAAVLAVANAATMRGGDGLIVTALVAFVNRSQRTLTFANAGHPPPLMLSPDGHAYLHQPPADLPLGIFASFRAATYVVAIPPNALIVLYTDGITEIDFDPERGEAELADAARACYSRSNPVDAAALAGEMFRGRTAIDDAALLVLHANTAVEAEAGVA